MDYTQLTAARGVPGSLSTWVNDSRIQGDVPEIILEAESWIYRRLRHWLMLTPPLIGNMTANAQGTASPVDSIPLPADFLEACFLTITGIYQLTLAQKTYQEVVSNWSFDGNGYRVPQQPIMYYFDQSAIRFDSPPDLAYQYALIYFQQPPALAVSGSNFLTTTYPRLVRCACMAAATEWMKDSGQGNFDRTYWDTLAQDEIEKAQAESDRAKRATASSFMLAGGGAGTSQLGNGAGSWGGNW